MTTKHGFRHKDYLLHCDPMPLRNGRFGAQVRVESGHGGATMFNRLFPSLGDFATEAEAVEHAKQVGMRWIDDQG